MTDTASNQILDMCCGSRMFWIDKQDDRPEADHLAAYRQRRQNSLDPVFEGGCMTDKTNIPASREYQIINAIKAQVADAISQGHDQIAVPVEAIQNILAHLDVISKSEWKLAGDLTELQMNYSAPEHMPDAIKWRWKADEHSSAGAWIYIDIKEKFEDIKKIDGAEWQYVFTAPQKPVVTAPNRKDMFWTAANAGLVAKCDNEWKAAIEAVGGIVRDSE